MRLDKFLKVSRIIKRRTVAKEVADQGRVKINGNVAKSSSQIAVGDELEIAFGQRIVTYEVLALMDSTKKDDAKDMYRIIAEEGIQADDRWQTSEFI